MFSDISDERKGEIFAVSSSILHGAMPILINYVVGFAPAIFYAGASTLCAAFFLFFYLIFAKRVKEILNPDAFKYIILVAIFVVIFPSIFIFKGTSYTSGVNTAILMETEIFFTFIVSGLFFKEMITRKKLIGAFIIMLGAFAVLYNGNFIFNKGDFLIIAGTLFYPFGNHFAKKALKRVHPSVVLFMRSLIGGSALILISFYFEKTHSNLSGLIFDNLLFIFLNGFFIFFIAKAIWYEALKRLDLTKAIPIVMTSPAFALIFAAFIFKEMPTAYQIVGFFIILIGLKFITKKHVGAIAKG